MQDTAKPSMSSIKRARAAAHVPPSIVAPTFKAPNGKRRSVAEPHHYNGRRGLAAYLDSSALVVARGVAHNRLDRRRLHASHRSLAFRLEIAEHLVRFGRWVKRFARLTDCWIEEAAT
jgi:hypothetical protein